MVFPECVVTPKSLIKAVATKVYVSGTLGIENAIFLAIEPESLGSTVMVGPFVLPHLCRNIKIFSPLLYLRITAYFTYEVSLFKKQKLRNAKVKFF